MVWYILSLEQGELDPYDPRCSHYDASAASDLVVCVWSLSVLWLLAVCDSPVSLVTDDHGCASCCFENCVYAVA